MKSSRLVILAIAMTVSLPEPSVATQRSSEPSDCGGRKWGVDDIGGVRLTDAQGSWDYWIEEPLVRNITVRQANGRLAVLFAFGRDRQRFEANFGPVDYERIAPCIAALNLAVHQGGGWWPEYALVPVGSEPWIEGQQVGLATSPDYPNLRRRPGRVRLDAWLHSLPGDDLIRWERDLLVLKDATPFEATSLLGPNAPNSQMLNGLPRTIAQDFVAKNIVRLDHVTATTNSAFDTLTLTIWARAADRTRHKLTYSGPTVPRPSRN